MPFIFFSSVRISFLWQFVNIWTMINIRNSSFCEKRVRGSPCWVLASNSKTATVTKEVIKIILQYSCRIWGIIIDKKLKIKLTWCSWSSNWPTKVISYSVPVSKLLSCLEKKKVNKKTNQYEINDRVKGMIIVHTIFLS